MDDQLDFFKDWLPSTKELKEVQAAIATICEEFLFQYKNSPVTSYLIGTFEKHLEYTLKNISMEYFVPHIEVENNYGEIKVTVNMAEITEPIILDIELGKGNENYSEQDEWTGT